MKVIHVPSSLEACQYIRSINSQTIINTYRCCLHFCYFRYVILVINAIAQHIAKVPQCTLESVCSSFFLGFLEGSSFSLGIFYVAVPNILKSFKLISVKVSRR
jgi:hypothetical protein